MMYLHSRSIFKTDENQIKLCNISIVSLEMKVDRNTSANTPTRMMNGDRHVACVDSFVFFKHVRAHTHAHAQASTSTHPPAHNTSHLAWTGPDLVSVGAYWQTEGVGRQMHCEKVRRSEAGGK